MKNISKNHGFTLVEEKTLSELNAVMYRLCHDKTGLELVWLKRDEENKSFGIAFETLPWNHTGVFHILEHSVLCGSDKYRAKEPFVELLKNSMNTFLNAMTFPDKTVYPVSSRNSQDFINLMRVYLDAVFHPLIYSKPEIFHQEGWHYEIDENGEASYKGVVFNEMKGALADADELSVMAINDALFPDSPYKYVSGGDPAKIPDLSYEEFIESHRRFYSPSNAYVFLDGDLDIDAALSVINEEYLTDFERGERIAPPALQAPVAPGEKKVEFELSEGENPETSYRLNWAGVVGTYADNEKTIATSILANVLTENNQSPLSRAILSKGLAEKVSFGIQDGVLQPIFSLEVKNFKLSDREEIENTLRDEINRLITEGIDRNSLKAAMANYEFRLRERDYGSAPQGLIFGLVMLESWLYGGHPADLLEVGDLFVNLEAKMNEGYFENLLKELLLENDHFCKVLLVPSHNAGEQRRKLEADRLKAEQSLWNDEIREKLIAEQKILQDWQGSEDSPEVLAAMPHLTLDDISDEPEEIPTSAEIIRGINVVKHTVNTNGIVYLNLYFNAERYTEDEYSKLSFLCRLLGKLKTSKHSAEEIITLKKLLCGNLGFSVETYSVLNNPADCPVKLHVSASVLEHNIDKALSLIAEILTDTQFDDEKGIADYLKQDKTRMFESAVMGGHAIAIGRISARNTAAGVVKECVQGYKYYQWLSAKDAEIGSLANELSDLLKGAAGKNILTVSVTETDCECAERIAEVLSNLLPDGAPDGKLTVKPWEHKKEGIVIPADIAFAGMGGSLLENGGKSSGQLLVANRIITYGYLWNAIRVQGGAYGTGLMSDRSGLAACYSYRDPTGAKSLESYQGAAGFLKSLCSQDIDLTGFIIGAISDLSPLLSPRLKGTNADYDYFTGFSREDNCRRWSSLVHCTKEDLIAVADSLEKTIAGGSVCVVGSREQINKCEGLEGIEVL